MLKRRKGEVATLLTLGLVLVGALITLGTSLFISNKKINLASNSRAAGCNYNDIGKCFGGYLCSPNGCGSEQPPCLIPNPTSCPTPTSTPPTTVPTIPTAGGKCGSGGIYNCPTDPISKQKCSPPSATKGYEFGCCVMDNPNNKCDGKRWRWYGCTGQYCVNTSINNKGIGGDGKLHPCPDDYISGGCYGGKSPTATPTTSASSCTCQACPKSYKNSDQSYCFKEYGGSTPYYKNSSGNCSGYSYSDIKSVCGPLITGTPVPTSPAANPTSPAATAAPTLAPIAACIQLNSTCPINKKNFTYWKSTSLDCGSNNQVPPNNDCIGTSFYNCTSTTWVNYSDNQCSGEGSASQGGYLSPTPFPIVTTSSLLTNNPLPLLIYNGLGTDLVINSITLFNTNETQSISSVKNLLISNKASIKVDLVSNGLSCRTDPSNPTKISIWYKQAYSNVVSAVTFNCIIDDGGIINSNLIIISNN